MNSEEESQREEIKKNFLRVTILFKKKKKEAIEKGGNYERC